MTELKEAFDNWVKTQSQYDLAGSDTLFLAFTAGSCWKNKQSQEDIYTTDEITFDLKRKRVFRAGVDLHFTEKQFDICVFLAKSPREVCKTEVITETFWGKAYSDVAERYLRVFITNIRKKLPDIHIDTITGVGYEWKGKWNHEG